MKTDYGPFKLRAELMAGPTRNAMFAFLRASGLNEVEALDLAIEIQMEKAAQIRRSGLREILAGSVLSAGAVSVLVTKTLPMGREGLFIVLGGLAGVAMLFRGLPKVTMSNADYFRATEQEPGGASGNASDDAVAGGLAKTIPSVQAYGVLFGFVAIVVGVGWWVMFAK